MARRHRRAIDLGEAVSFDSVLTILTVLLVLRMVFLIPMVNLDRAKTEDARRDPLWARQTAWLARHGSHEASRPYDLAFGTSGSLAQVSDSGDLRVLEALSPDSSLLVVEHDLATGHFLGLRVESQSEAPSFRRGRLLWSPVESRWFAVSDSVDYGQSPDSRALLERSRERAARREATP